MSVISGLAKATVGAKVLTGTRPTTKVFRNARSTLVVLGVVLPALVASAVLILASQAPSTDDSSTARMNANVRVAPPVSEPGPPQMSEQEALDAYGKLPLSFIPNEGQTDKAVRYYAQGAGYGFFFTQKGATLSLAEGKGRGHALALDFLGANPNATLTAQERLSGKVNYLVGNDPAQWQQRLPSHGELLYGGLWPGIDMAVRGEGGKLKYEFHLKPGSSVKNIRLGYRGAEGLKVGAGGELLVRTSLGILKDAAPVSYQRIDGERVPVKSHYRLTGDRGYGFSLGAYDPRYPLIIDPVLDYSTFLGGSGFDFGMGIAVDGHGRGYVTGFTTAANYPTSGGAFDTTHNGNEDAFVTKLNAAGSELVYSTFLGGFGDDRGLDIAVDGRGRAYATGETPSEDYPTTPGAYDRTFNGLYEAFVTKLNAAGSELAYSTFLGGTSRDRGESIAVQGGRAYVTGLTDSGDYPTTRGAFDRTFNGLGEAFVTKLNAAGSELAYSTFLGGRSVDNGWSIAVDGRGRAYVTGETLSEDYPTTPGAYDRFHNGSFDTFVTKLNVAGSELVYSTLLGGTSLDTGLGIAVRDGRAYVTGVTESADYPTTRGAFDRTLDLGGDAFVTKLNASGSELVYSTLLGGKGGASGNDIAVDGRGRAYVTGETLSENYPTTPGAYDRTFNGDSDAYVTKLNASGSGQAYSTFLGGTISDLGWGIAVQGGRAYVTGLTDSGDYPTTRGAFDRTFNFGGDAFVTKLPTS